MLVSESHLSQHHLFRIKNTEINEIYAVMSVRSTIVSLINIFIPIYLYTITYSIQAIILYYLIMFVVEAILEYPAMRLIAHFGPKHSIAFSLPFLVLNFWTLWTYPQYHWPIWLIAILGSVTMAFFWQAYHYDFSKSKEKKRTTKQISTLYIIIAFLSALGPLVGGIIAQKFGLNMLFGIVTGLVLLTIFPLFVQREPHIKHKPQIRKIFNKNILRQIVAYGGSGVEASTTMIFWPLFLFFVLGTYQQVGFVVAASLAVTVIVTYLIGHVADRKSKKYFINVGGLLTAALGALRIFVYSLTTAIIVNLLRGVTHSMYESPFVAEYYLHADEQSRTEYIFLMEFGIDLMRVLFFAILFAISFYLTGPQLLVWALLIGAVFTFLLTLMPAAKNEKNAIN
ncbi:MAG: MFS transporter [bacterium]